MTALAPRRAGRETWTALAFLVPSLFGFVVFCFRPTLQGCWCSLTGYSFVADTSFAGLENYQRLLGDESLWNTLLVAVEYVVLNIGFQRAAYDRAEIIIASIVLWLRTDLQDTA